MLDSKAVGIGLISLLALGGILAVYRGVSWMLDLAATEEVDA